MNHESEIRAQAAALGFGACGFAAVAPVARDAFLAGWLDAGFAGDMHYLARRPERRLSVAGILPEARTVITLAYPYRPPAPADVDWCHELRGRVAAYALGDDYHRVLERKLRALEGFLAAAYPRCRTRRYVDTGAVLEREWAVRGGLGWFGKNTMLLSTRAGSWFFLAELVTDLELVPDEPTGSHCGRCTSCLDACPTQALADGLVMDARRCISYLTIEHRGPIPRPLRAAMGPWIFGCDVCQEVCPWNSPSPPDEQRTAFQHPYLPDLLALDEPTFHARFRHTPLTRAKRRGLLRNAAVALGNTNNPAAVPSLTQAMQDPEPLVRSHAAWALGAINDRSGRNALERARNDADATVREEVEAALSGEIGAN